MGVVELRVRDPRGDRRVGLGVDRAVRTVVVGRDHLLHSLDWEHVCNRHAGRAVRCNEVGHRALHGTGGAGLEHPAVRRVVLARHHLLGNVAAIRLRDDHRLFGDLGEGRRGGGGGEVNVLGGRRGEGEKNQGENHVPHNP